MSNMPPSDEAIAEIIHKIQTYIFPRRLRVKEFFVNFDPLRCGRVTVPHFSRAIDTIGVRLTEKECLDLSEHFTQAGPGVVEPQVVSYARFCDVLDEVFADGGPAVAQMSSSPSSTMLATFQPNSFEDEDYIMHILHRVAALCKTRGMVLKECFMDTERDPKNPSPSRQTARRAGKVTRKQFLRFFPFVKEFSKADMDAIAERYKTEGGDVHFMALHNDVTEYLHTGEQPFAQSTLVLRPDPAKWAQQSLDPVHKLRAKIVERRVRITEHFQDFDPLRKGICTVRQVKTVFTILNIEKEVTRSEFDTIVSKYLRHDDMFCYTDFCEDIDKDFTTKGLEAMPLATVNMPDKKTTAPARRNKRVLTAEEQDEINRIEDYLRYHVRTRGIHLNPTFKDMDKMHKGFITKGQFMRCLDMLKFGLNQESVKLLASLYADRGNHLDVNYVDFIKSVDKPDADSVIALAQHQQTYKDWVPPTYFDHRGNIGKAGIAVLV
jgi:hypothetical protein